MLGSFKTDIEHKRFYFSLLLVVCALIVVIWRIVFSTVVLTAAFQVSMMIDLLGISLLFISQTGCILEKSNDPETKNRFSGLMLVVGVTWFIDMLSWTVDGNTDLGWVIASYIINSLYYLANIFAIRFAVRYLVAAARLHGKPVRIFLWVLHAWFAIMIILIIMNLFMPLLFTIRNGFYERQFFSNVVFVVDGSFLLLTLYFVSSSNIDRISRLAIWGYVMIPFFGIILQTLFYGFSFLTMATIISMFILYVHLYVHQGYVMEEQRQELLKNQTAVMLSQIQPHFLFNSLSTIIALCDLDPQLAKKTTEDFSTYLEHNLKAVTDAQLIPFEKELEQIQAYLRIEKARFGDLLNVEYDLPVTGFGLPSLTVQPMVENAVKHGIHDKPEGGTVKISTREEPEFWIVIVEDDGVGFDATRGNRKGGFGVGIDNVRKRLSAMCKGSVAITSEEGKGTHIEIRIPKEI